MVNASSKKRPRDKSSSSDESENEYVVEAIVDKRFKGKKLQYLLKWKGYSDADNTWEDKSQLNCPGLVKAFEDSLKTKKPTKTKQRTTKRGKLDDSNQSNEDQSMNVEDDNESNIKDNDDDNEQNGTHHSPRVKTSSATSNKDESSSKSRNRSTSKTESLNGEIVKENADNHEMETTNEISNTEDEDNNNTSIELLDKSSPIEENLLTEQTNEPPVNLRLRITPSSASSISIALNDSDNNNNNTNEKCSTDNPIDISNDQDTAEIIEDVEPIEKIEGVKNDQNGIVFRIKLVDQSEPQWIAAKIANRKYPQAVIAFWESHVEFT
jgi:hypothetical protein